jgi:hypothetical protein
VPALFTWPTPDGLDAARAACIPVAYGTAQECLFTAGNLQAGQAALIHAGAGGVGMAAIQLAKQAGATVISTASSDEKLERLKEFGLDHGINYATVLPFQGLRSRTRRSPRSWASALAGPRCRSRGSSPARCASPPTPTPRLPQRHPARHRGAAAMALLIAVNAAISSRQMPAGVSDSSPNAAR